jgi:hypothetical protein
MADVYDPLGIEQEVYDPLGITKEKKGILPALSAGIKGSIPGMMVRQAPPPEYEPEGAAQRFAHGLGSIVPELPIYATGAAVGAASGGLAAPVTGAAGAFALPAGVRKVLEDKYSKGKVTSIKDFADRLGGAVKETGKGYVTGAAVGAVGKVAPLIPKVGKYAKFPAEIATMTTVPAVLEGKLPTTQDFHDAFLLLGALKVGTATPGKLRKIYTKYKKKPAEVVEEYKEGTLDPEIKKDLETLEVESAKDVILENKFVKEEKVKNSIVTDSFTSKKGNVYKKIDGEWRAKNGTVVTNAFVVKAAERNKVPFKEEKVVPPEAEVKVGEVKPETAVEDAYDPLGIGEKVKKVYKDSKLGEERGSFSTKVKRQRESISREIKDTGGSIKKDAEYMENGEWNAKINEKDVKFSSYYNPEVAKWHYKIGDGDWEIAGDYPSEFIPKIIEEVKKTSTTKDAPKIIAENNKVFSTKAPISLIEEMQKNPEYYRTAKNSEVVYSEMSPNDYVRKQAKIKGVNLTEDVKAADLTKVKKYAEEMKKYAKGEVGENKKFPALWLEEKYKNQEGKHRALAAIIAGVDKVPVYEIKEIKAKEKGPTLYSGIDPTKIPEALRGIKDSTKLGWEVLKAKSPELRKAVRIKDTIIKDIKDQFSDPSDRLRKDPPAKESFKILLKAEEDKNAFLYRNLTEKESATKGIKDGTPESEQVGKALDGQIPVSKLTKKEKRAYDFFKKNYDFLIKEYAQRSAGSEEAYKKVLRNVGAENPKRTLVRDLKGDKLNEYKVATEKAKGISKGRKLSELSQEEKISYSEARQEMRDILNRSYVDTLSPGERQAHDILSRKITDYLPRLFDQKELLEAFKVELKMAEKKLEFSTNAAVGTKYKNKINQLKKSINKIEGGNYVAFRQLPKEIFFKFFSPRKGREGYSFDAMKAYDAYIYGLAKKMFDEPALKKITTEFYPNVSPELKPYLRELLDHYMGYKKYPFEDLARTITTFQWMRTLGFNPRSALVNLTQRVNTLAFVGEKYSAKAEGMIIKDAIAKKTDKLKGIKREYESDKLFDETGIAREVPSVLMEGAPSVGMKAVNDIARYMFNAVELGNRKHAYLAGYLKGTEIGVKKGLKNEALKAFAKKEGIKTVHTTQFRYGKLGMPKVYWNPTARVALQFTSYPLKQARFLMNLFKKDKAGFLKYVAYTTGITYTLQEFLDTDMSNALGFGITWGEMLSTVKSLAEGDMKGAMRHAKQSVSPGEGMLPSGFGPTVTSTSKVVRAAGSGKGFAQLKKELTPVMYNRLKQAYQAFKDRGGEEYPIYNTKGELSYNLTGRQLAQRTLGPRTYTEKKSSLEDEKIRNLELERKEVLADMVKAIISDDDKTLIELVEMYGILPTSGMVEYARSRKYLTRKELKKAGKQEEYQILREGKIY